MKKFNYLILAATGLVGAAGPLFADIVYTQDFSVGTSLGDTVIAATDPTGFSELSWGNYDNINSLPVGWAASCSGANTPPCGVLAFVATTPSLPGYTNFGFDGTTGILLNEVPGSANSISTDLSPLLTAGQTYNLSFQYWSDNNGLNGSYPFSVIIDGTTNISAGPDNPPSPNGTFNTETLSFVASGSDTLEFTETTPDNDQASVIIDNISVSSAPEPGTFGLLLAASGLMIFGLRKTSSATL